MVVAAMGHLSHWDERFGGSVRPFRQRIGRVHSPFPIHPYARRDILTRRVTFSHRRRNTSERYLARGQRP